MADLNKLITACLEDQPLEATKLAVAAINEKIAAAYEQIIPQVAAKMQTGEKIEAGTFFKE